MRERAATPDDYPRFVEFQRVLGLSFEALPEERWRENLMPASFFLEDEAGAVVGYAMWRAYGPHGDVRQIAVAPEARRRGVGRELMRRVAAKLRGAGCGDWRLEVRTDNVAAIALYRSMGMTMLSRQVRFRIDGAAMEALVAGAVVVDEELVAVGAEDQPAVEARFDLPPGKLARMEQVRPGGAVFVLERDGVVVGLARFHPELAPDLGFFFPLRAANAADAQSLCAACLRGAAVPREVELCVESPALEGWLIAAGHAPDETLAVMGGAIPS